MTTLEKLKKLEKSGEYLFHGSDTDIERFEPKQAHTIKGGKKFLDGKPAVFASPHADYAIFMAIVNKKNFPKGYRARVDFDGDPLLFFATKDTLAQMTGNEQGFVYVFTKEDFEERNHAEFVSYKEVVPLMKIRVYRKDFLPSIEVL